jgi:hypothetical protein
MTENIKYVVYMFDIICLNIIKKVWNASQSQGYVKILIHLKKHDRAQKI